MRPTPLFALVFAGCATTTQKAAVSEWILFEQADGHINFNVMVDGVPARAMLDSGAVGSLVDGSFAEANHLVISESRALQITGAFGTTGMRVAGEFKIAFIGEHGAEGKVPVGDAIIMDTPRFGVDVVLGRQFFRRLILQIDYVHSRFRYMTRGAMKMDEAKNADVRRDSEGRLNVRVQVGGKDLWLLLDTGAGRSTYLPRRAAERQGWLDLMQRAGEARHYDIARSKALETYVLPLLKIGPFEVENVPVTVQKIEDARETIGDTKTGTHLTLGEEETGILGTDVLRHFLVTIDLEEEQLNLSITNP